AAVRRARTTGRRGPSPPRRRAPAPARPALRAPAPPPPAGRTGTPPRRSRSSRARCPHGARRGGGGPPASLGRARVSGSSCRDGSPAARFAPRGRCPALLPRPAGPRPSAGGRQLEGALQPVEGRERIAGVALARRGADRAAQRFGLGHLPALRDPLECPDGLHVERVGRPDRRCGHTRLLWPYATPPAKRSCRRWHGGGSQPATRLGTTAPCPPPCAPDTPSPPPPTPGSCGRARAGAATPARRAHQGAELLREEALEAVGLGDQRVRVGLDQHDEAHYGAPDPSCVTSSISAPDGASARSPSSFVRPGTHDGA